MPLIAPNRAIRAAALLALPLALATGCRWRGGPEIPNYAGEARVSSVTRPTLPRETLDFRKPDALLTEPEPCRGSFAAAIACAGSTIVIGAPEAGRSGKVWVYDANRLETAPIALLPRPEANGERFGASVAITPSGDRIAVGSPMAPSGKAREIGRVDLWKRTEAGWQHEQAFLDPDTSCEGQHFGTAVVIDDECLVASAPDADLEVIDDVLQTRVRWPRPDPDKPMPTGAIEPVIEDVTVPTVRQRFMREGALLVWQRDKTGAWQGPVYSFFTRGRPMMRFGLSMAQAGAQTVVSAPPQMTKHGVETGSISVFVRRPGNAWRVTPNHMIALEDSEAADRFGTSVATAPGLVVAGVPDGNIALAPDVGRVAVFQQNVATRIWIESDPVPSPAPEPGSNFGQSVAVWGDVVLAGQPNSTRTDGTGHVFAFRKRPSPNSVFRSAWEPFEEWVPPPIGTIHAFGNSMAASAELVAVGAPGRDGSKGHVVIFRKPAAPPAPTAAEAAKAPEGVPEAVSEPPPSNPGSSL